MFDSAGIQSLSEYGGIEGRNFFHACNKLEESIADRLEESKETNLLEVAVRVLADLARDHRNLYKLIYLSDYRSEKTFLEEWERYQTNKLIIKELTTRYKIDDRNVEGIFERLSLLTHGICTVIATTSMHYSNEQVVGIINDALTDVIGNRMEDLKYEYKQYSLH